MAGLARTITAADAAAAVRPGDWVDYGACLSQPDVFDAALALRAAELRDVSLRSCISVRPRAVVEADPEGRAFTWYSWHFSAWDRAQHDRGLAHYMPVNLGEVPDYYRRFIDRVDVAVLKTCPMDETGVFNFSATGLWNRAIVEKAKTVIVEVVPQMPWCAGEGNGVHVSEVDAVLDGGDAPPPELLAGPLTDIDRAVGRHIAAEIEDGACLQVGIGGMPNAVCAALLEAGVKDLGLHSEMLTDGMVDLYRAGLVTGARKVTHPGKSVYSFALGTRRLYETLHRNPDFQCLQVDRTNLPHIVMQNPRTVAINGTTQVDLQGQAASESDGARHISGTGGQLQFVRGAYAAEGGKSFLCLPSVYEKNGHRRSRIVPQLTPGNIVTTPRSDVMSVVTEWGIANLKGKSVADRATALIAIAHPDFREDLMRAARENRMVPPHYRG
jgi:acyl-CoA hydrolase